MDAKPFPCRLSPIFLHQILMYSYRIGIYVTYVLWFRRCESKLVDLIDWHVQRHNKGTLAKVKYINQ